MILFSEDKAAAYAAYLNHTLERGAAKHRRARA